MAILSEPGIEVAVIVNGQRLEEYDDDEEPRPKTVTKYIEAQSGTEFAIATSFKPPFPTQCDIKTCLYIDGKIMESWRCKHHQLLGKTFLKDYIYSQQDRECVKQKFYFAELEIMEEARYAPNVASVREALSAKGQVTLKFDFVTNVVVRGKGKPRNPIDYKGLVALENIPEKALKGDALSHQTVFSKPLKANRKALKDITYKYLDKEPFATFNFKYRSRASLKALRLTTVEETAPIPLADRPEEELTPVELRELLQRFRSREAETRSEEQDIKVEP
ncbi:hypothetical protein A1F94_005006 [Pyrenophora tritici-repentis]|nr:hypothetical protein A1F94_005006 [Pyrenophora tritici-repentis]KAI1535167.1 hypothetical protein PtrSN001C_006979 [Pyrenophora tritici-repentis]KAI1599923.1 hypothetical protein PtrCC142_007072 [Pyrenophora tritici-repentis]KAI1669725.1 hypothetical protein L13192_05241 [Pyrenophora tritici-repentis]